MKIERWLYCQWMGRFNIGKTSVLPCWGLNVLPPNSYVQSLAASNSECECVWRQHLWRENKGKTRSYGWDLVHYNWWLTRRGHSNTDHGVTAGGHSEQAAICKRRRAAAAETKLATPYFLAAQLARSEFPVQWKLRVLIAGLHQGISKQQHLIVHF